MLKKAKEEGIKEHFQRKFELSVGLTDTHARFAGNSEVEKSFYADYMTFRNVCAYPFSSACQKARA